MVFLHIIKMNLYHQNLIVILDIFFDDDILVASVPNNQGSGNLRGMVDCNGLTFLPAGVDGIKDDFVDAIWIR